MAAGIYPDRKGPDYEPTTNVGERRKEMNERISWEEREKLIDEEIEMRRSALSEYLEHLRSLCCELCPRHGSRVSLLGGRAVVLCDGHLNAWREFFHSHRLSGRYNDAQAEFYVSLYQRSEEVAKACNRVWQEVTDAIYELSGEWLEEEKMKWLEC